MKGAIAWALLLGAGGLEIIWATALKASHGFSRPWPTVLSLGAAAASFCLLALAMRALPLAVAYPVWVGVGVVGVALAGAILFEEPLSSPRLACVVLITVGIIGLQILDAR